MEYATPLSLQAERVDQLLERYERSSRSIEGLTNGYLIYDLNIYASIARHYAQTVCATYCW